MRVPLLIAAVVCLLAGRTVAEEVQITIFTLKDGTELEAISHASALLEGESVHSITTTDGERRVFLSGEITGQRNVFRILKDLPEFAQKKLASQQKAQQNWSVQAAAEREAEEQKRRSALIRAAEMADEGRAAREAEAEERAVRQRCATLWDAQQAALGRARAAQTALARARDDYQDASNDLRSLDRWRPRSPEETTRWRFLLQRAQRQQDSAQDDIREAQRALDLATNQANQFAEQLSRAKAELTKAQQRMEEAQQRYREAQERFKQPVSVSDPGNERIVPVPQDAGTLLTVTPPVPRVAPEPVAQSTILRNIEEGTFVQLADGSLWEIHPEDRIASANWQSEQDVMVLNGNDPTYAHRLVNNTTHMAVKARKLK